MACRLADNQPLMNLRAALGVAKTCHSLRPDCIHRLQRPEGETALGAVGAVIGYCQALFVRRGSAGEHTTRVGQLLAQIGAPWAQSHELFWGHKGTQSAEAFLVDAIQPLRSLGRVPILITPLKPATDGAAIAEICAVSPPVAEHEPVLVRVVVTSEDDIDVLATSMRAQVRLAFQTGDMPVWWPLIQGSLSLDGWKSLREKLGDAWQFANIAVNPFMSSACMDYVQSQITVAQIPVGLATVASSEGWVELPSAMVISDRAGNCGYSLPQYLAKFEHFQTCPSMILLGPSDPTWSDETNQGRIAAILPIVKEASDKLWSGLTPAAKELVWSLAA
jgi:hypothetical protein